MELSKHQVLPEALFERSEFGVGHEQSKMLTAPFRKSQISESECDIYIIY